MRVIRKFQANDRAYKGEAKPRKEWSSSSYLMPKESYEAQLIAQLIEGDFGFTATMHFVNMYRAENDKLHVGRSAVYETCKRLKPTVTKILKRQQGNLDVTSDWCMASHRWATQLLIIFGDLKQDQVPAKFLLVERREDTEVLPRKIGPSYQGTKPTLMGRNAQEATGWKDSIEHEARVSVPVGRTRQPRLVRERKT